MTGPDPLFWVVLGLLAIITALVFGYLHLLDKLDGGDTYQPTRRQRRQWRQERLEIPRALVNRRRMP